MSISNNLKVLRNKKHVSQQDVADFLGVERKTYISWEEGADVKSSYIPKLAEYFQVEINDLFRENSKEIVVNQYNKDNSVNTGIIVLLTDKDAVNQLVEIIKGKFEKK